MWIDVLPAFAADDDILQVRLSALENDAPALRAIEQEACFRVTLLMAVGDAAGGAAMVAFDEERFPKKEQTEDQRWRDEGDEKADLPVGGNDDDAEADDGPPAADR